MAAKIFVKDPNETRLFDVEFADKLASGETLTSPTGVASPTTLTIDSATVSGTDVRLKLSSGTSGTNYVVTTTASTSLGNSLEKTVNILVINSNLYAELLIMLRYLINDLDDENYTYSDARLIPLLVLAASHVIQDVNLSTTYSVNVRTMTISPDPSDDGTRDADFLYFIALKAACIVDQMTFRTKALTGGIQATCGPVSISTAGQMASFKELLDKGPCAIYTQATLEYNHGNGSFVKSVLSPFRGPDVDLANRWGDFYFARSGH